MARFSRLRSKILAKEAESKEQAGTEAQAPELANLADASARFFAGQTAAMTMMTAFGMSLTAQMTSAFMGAVANALDKGEGAAAAPASEAKAKSEPTAKVVPLRVIKKERAPAADDLKKISGLGPKLEKVLNGMGIRTFAEIAKWSEAEMREIDDKLGLDNRVIRDNWASQAKALLEG
jgi:NADH-quinone oxidoreductase subunit E